MPKTLILMMNAFSVLTYHSDLVVTLSEGPFKYCDVMSRNH